MPFIHVFPAYAGMNRFGRNFEAEGESVPRIRGDEPVIVWTLGSVFECSPHTRG